MARSPRKRKEAAAAAPPQQTADIVAALEWCKVAQKDIGNPNETHCLIGHGAVVAFDGIIAAGHLCGEAGIASPHTIKMLSAMQRAKTAVSIMQTANGDLSITSGKFHAVIPCQPVENIVNIVPDANIANADDRLKQAFGAVQTLAAEGSQAVVTASILVRANTCIATDRVLVLEAWHGIDLPTLVIPKAAATLISKQAKTLVGFGYSATSVTFWFEGNCWIRTQQYVETWPDIDRVLNDHDGYWYDLPADFWDAITATAPFTDDGNLHVINGIMRSHDTTGDVGARYDCKGFDFDWSFNAKRIQQLMWATRIGFDARREKAYFESPKSMVRAGLALVYRQQPIKTLDPIDEWNKRAFQKLREATKTGIEIDDDIPY
jgi:hypothetical protein